MILFIYIHYLLLIYITQYLIFFHFNPLSTDELSSPLANESDLLYKEVIDKLRSILSVLSYENNSFLTFLNEI